LNKSAVGISYLLLSSLSSIMSSMASSMKGSNGRKVMWYFSWNTQLTKIRHSFIGQTLIFRHNLIMHRLWGS
jgi:hypothetical protein